MAWGRFQKDGFRCNFSYTGPFLSPDTPQLVEQSLEGALPSSAHLLYLVRLLKSSERRTMVADLLLPSDEQKRRGIDSV